MKEEMIEQWRAQGVKRLHSIVEGNTGLLSIVTRRLLQQYGIRGIPGEAVAPPVIRRGVSGPGGQLGFDEF